MPTSVTKTVLIVDDDRIITTLMTTWLNELGCIAVHAANIPDAISIVQAINVDAVSVDLAFPEGSGFDLIRFLKSGPVTRSIPIIVVSVKDSSDVITATILAGAVLFVAKPTDFTQIKNSLSMLLQLPADIQPLRHHKAARQSVRGRWIL